MDNYISSPKRENIVKDKSFAFALRPELSKDCTASWRAKPETLEEKGWEAYADTPGFCKSEALETIRKFDHVLTPGRYVETGDDDQEALPFPQVFADLQEQLEAHFKASEDLSSRIRRLLGSVDQ